MEASGNDIGQTPPQRTGRSKSRACDTMMGAARNSDGWSEESNGSNALGARVVRTDRGYSVICCDTSSESIAREHPTAVLRLGS